ncbi:hypothetical protein ACFFSY_09605 [Paenibacillus aurantiacus]|uniref:Uncharacterized protein n=1 Tax=Paenibacillus aurantiacus TaxID=1936118 RepID=A0ABV5KLR0_9BACL
MSTEVMENMIELSGVHKRYLLKTVLTGIDLQIKKDSIVGLSARTGVGSGRCRSGRPYPSNVRHDPHRRASAGREPQEAEELAGGSLKRGYRTMWAERQDRPSAPPPSVPSLSDTAELAFKGMGLAYERLTDDLVRLSFTGENGAWIVLVRMDEEEGLPFDMNVSMMDRYFAVIEDGIENGFAMRLEREIAAFAIRTTTIS